MITKPKQFLPVRTLVHNGKQYWFQATIDLNRLDAMAIKAIRSASKKSKDGVLTVDVLKEVSK